MDGRADFAVLLEPFESADLDFVRLQTQERWVAAIRPDDPLAEKRAASATDLASTPLILPHRAESRSVLASWFGRHYAHLDVVGTANLNVAGDALVRAGMGRSLQIALPHAADELVRLPLDPPLVTGSALAWQRGKVMPRTSIAFAKFVQELVLDAHNA